MNPESWRLTKHILFLLLISSVAISLASQSRIPVEIDLSQTSTRLTRGFYGVEQDYKYTFRWTEPDASIRFPNPWKSKPILLHLTASAERFGDQVYTATVTVNDIPVGAITKAGWRDWTFLVSDPRLLERDDLLVGLHSQGFVPSELYSTSIDDRDVGIAVKRVDIRPEWVPPIALPDWLALLTLPSPWLLTFASVIVIGLYLLSRALGTSSTRAFVFACVAILIMSVQTAFYRLAPFQFGLLAVFTVGALTAINELVIPRAHRRWNSSHPANLAGRAMITRSLPRLNIRATRFALIVAFSSYTILLSLFTVNMQVQQLGLGYIEGVQLTHHTDVLQGSAKDPFQYRILSEYLVEGVVYVLTSLRIPEPTVSAFISFRIIQNILIFLFAYVYYKRLGLSSFASVIGISMLAWGMINAFYDSDLEFNTYSDVVFYLLAGIAILNGRHWWIIPITALAAINRETSGLIPFMLLGVILQSCKNWNVYTVKRSILVVATALALYVYIFLGIRYILGPRALFIAYGNSPGVQLLIYNIGREVTWIQLFATLSILPIMALLAIGLWPPTLRGFFWVIVPIWFSVHLFASVLAETRLVLVPQALVFVPGALFGLVYWNHKVHTSGKIGHS